MTSFLDAAHVTRPVVLSDSDLRWPAEYAALAVRLHAAAGAHAMRIDHIGSTSVPGLAAKDVIDIQVTVADIDDCDALVSALHTIGFRRGDVIEHDEARDPAITPHQLRKRYMREPVGEKRVHVHIRQQGMLRQRHALLFRDFLRATPEVREGYEMMKRRAAELFPRNIDGYLWLKAPIIHVIHVTAEQWAEATGWTSDLPVG
ncbi:MAG TPA: GrpB family protein [Gemmatimonadaceae bacterium]|nr:GrpB family protein [Gemmatimonadaceae bacterium]